MLTKVIFLRGLEKNRQNIIPDVGVPLYTTDEKKLYIGDGVTPGGVTASGTEINALTDILDVPQPEAGLYLRRAESGDVYEWTEAGDKIDTSKHGFQHIYEFSGFAYNGLTFTFNINGTTQAYTLTNNVDITNICDSSTSVSCDRGPTTVTNIVDGDLGTYWDSEEVSADTTYVVLEFTSPVALNQLAISSLQHYAPDELCVERYNDTSEIWESLQVFTNITEWPLNVGDFVYFTFPNDVEATKYRVGLEPAQYHLRIYEIKGYALTDTNIPLALSEVAANLDVTPLQLTAEGNTLIASPVDVELEYSCTLQVDKPLTISIERTAEKSYGVGPELEIPLIGVADIPEPQAGKFLQRTFDGTGYSWVSSNESVVFRKEVRVFEEVTTVKNTWPLEYEVGYVDVWVNGLKLKDTDFAATDGVTVVLNDSLDGTTTPQYISIIARGETVSGVATVQEILRQAFLL